MTKISALASLLLCVSAQTTGAQVIDYRAYAGYFQQNSWAGSGGFTSSTWLMVQPELRTSRLRLGAHAMLSGDALINGECGQPQFLPESSPCGITANTPHPLVMMLGAKAALQLRAMTIGLEGSAVGEPAFGPHPYFTRASAQHDPAPPLTHHFFNPAHSAQGVVTASAAHSAFQLEISAFNARPLADLYEIDPGPLDAQAARLSFRQSDALRLQVSAAKFPDVGGHGHSGEMKAYSLTADGVLSNKLFYTMGCAAHRVSGETPKACFTEATLTVGRHLFYGRAEASDRLEENAIIDVLPDGTHVHTPYNVMLKASEFAVGYGLRMPAFRGLQTSVGVRAGVLPLSDDLRDRYQEKRAASVMMFLSARPANGAHHHH